MAKIIPHKKEEVDIWIPPTLSEWLVEAEGTDEWVVPNFIPYGGKVLISGHKKKACKTLFMLNMAITIATGKSATPLISVDEKFIGAPIVIILEEGTVAKTRDRVQKLCNSLEVDSAALNNIYWLFRKRVKLDSEEWQDKIINLVKKVKPALTAYDPFYKSHTGNENNAADVMPVVDTMEQIRNEDSAIVMVTHLGKAEGRNQRMDIDDQVRGTGVLTDDYDKHIALRRYKMSDPTIDLICRSKDDAEEEYSVGWDFADNGACLSMTTMTEQEVSFDYKIKQLDAGKEYTHKQLKDIWECGLSKMREYKDIALERGVFKITGDNKWLFKGDNP